MSTIRITSASSPFTTHKIARLAAGLIATAEAMGLLGSMEIRRLDLETFRQVVDRIAAAGIGTEVQAALTARTDRPAWAEMAELLRRLAIALEESPVPTHEWRALERVFGIDRLSSLLSISPASVRRYLAGARKTPDDVAGRLHFLATLVGDLSGAYNDFGVRRWLDRRRVQLDGHSPAELLSGNWDPDGAKAQRVRTLARSLGAAAAA